MKRGNPDSSILILGEAPGENEIKARLPFVGASGKELGKMLMESGIQESDLLFANVCNDRPPNNNIETWLPTSKKAALASGATWFMGRWVTKEILTGLEDLKQTIASMPNLQMIIALGNVPLWATTGEFGITKWRGSQMQREGLAIVPTYHPAAVLRSWDWRWIVKEDLKRAKQWLDTGLEVPSYEFMVRPTFNACCEFLDNLLNRLETGRTRVSTDIETRARHIACIGLALNSRSAICIPFMTLEGPYFSEVEEIEVVWKLYQVLTHPNVEVIGQNYLYDRQYIARRWGFRSNLGHDTMVKHHLCLPGTQKGLDFLSSIYCKFHLYWKDESKDWDPKLGEEQLWIYNCKDAVTTFEANEALDTSIRCFGLEQQLGFQMATGEIAFDMMLRGMAVNLDYKMDLHASLETMLHERLAFIRTCTGVALEPSSPKQVQSFCYDVLGLPPAYKHDKKNKTSRLTADKDAVEDWLLSCEPLFRPVLQAIVDYRSLQVYDSTFALSRLDTDGRFRCTISVAGPETFRWSTSEDAFGYGTNMQNLPRDPD